MNDSRPAGWAELDALQALVRSANLTLMRRPLTDLTMALNLGGYKFCIATPESEGYKILSVIAGGNLDCAPEGFLDKKIGPNDPILWESYRSTAPVSWTPYFEDDHLMDLSGVRQFADRGVTSGASIPILSRNNTCRATLCVSGTHSEPPGSLDLRLPAFWPLLKLAGLTLFETGVAEAAAHRCNGLTPCETAILSALSEGLRIKDIATKLQKSERTIRNQLDSARLRTGAATTIQAVVHWKQSTSLI